MADSTETLTVRGTVFQTPADDRFEALDDVVIVVVDGIIESITPASDYTGDIAAINVTIDDDSVLMPGLIDLHIHAPQWPQLGTALDMPLDEWLFAYTFPLEASFADEAFAQTVWDSMVPTLLANGTTTGVYYGSTHNPATTALAGTCVRFGQRAFVGRVAMDHPEGTPEWYRDASVEEALSASAESIEQIRALGSSLVEPIVTPRFIPACTDELLAGLGQLAHDTNTLVQTHCSENDWEHQYVIDRCGMSDTEALDSFGLLRPSTVLAHSVHLSDSDMSMIATNRAGVAHCPLSNTYFGDAVFPARRALAAGVAVGLGTDIAGGPSPSLFANAAHAINAARQLEDGVDAGMAPDERGVAESRIDAITAFWMATMGGAEVLGRPIGLLEAGRHFDAIAVTTQGFGDGTPPGQSADQSNERVFEKIVRLTTAADIASVWVNGQLVNT